MVSAPALPLTSYPVYAAVRGCTDCRLRRSCLSPVPGVGPMPAQVMAVGESPGEREDETGIPFTGMTGRLLDHLLGMAGLERSQVYLTNVIKCPSAHDAPPDLAARCASNWLDSLEARLVMPSTVVGMGQAAIRHLLGDPSLTVEHVHGIPHWIDGPRGSKTVMVFPTYNPAAGLNNTALLRMIWQDWRALGEILDGADPYNYVPIDQYPNPKYVRVENERDAREILRLPEYALDTETVPAGAPLVGRVADHSLVTNVGINVTMRGHSLWSIQVSHQAGTAYFIPAGLIPDPQTAIPPTSTVYVHNYLYDRQFIRIPNHVDTMVAAYLLGMPQGLKELAYRLAGMEMHSYEEYVYGGEEGLRMAVQYLQAVAGAQWPESERLSTDKWSDREGTMTRVWRKPLNVGKKAQRILADWEKDANVNMAERWRRLDPRERLVVEAELGPMPEPSLANIDPDAALYYSARDADATWRIKDNMLRGIRLAGLAPVFYGVDLPTEDQASEMMDTGMLVDPAHFEALSAEYMERLQESAEKCKVLAGQAFNPNSSDQLGDILYGEMGYPITRWTKTGKPSTDDRELKKVRVVDADGNEDTHPLVKEVLIYRGLLKNKATYTDKMPTRINPATGRVHTTLRLTRTETGRLSSADPNFQNIPIRSAEGKRIRDGFIAPEGWVLVALDYSQIELRVAAHYTKSPRLLAAFREGLDVHALTAADIFKVSYEEGKEFRFRYIGKVVNFAIFYGMTGRGLNEYLIEQGVEGWSLDDCDQMLTDYYVANPEVAQYQQQQLNRAVRQGWVTDLLGRRRFIPEVSCPIPRIRAEGARMAGNMPIQATAQEIIKMAGNRLRQERDAGRAPTDFRMLLQIHDDLMFEVREQDALAFAWWAKGIMENVFTLDVPIVAEAKMGTSWGSMTEMRL